MSLILMREVDTLKKKMLSLCAMVEETVWRAVKAMEERNEKLAKDIIDADIDIDHMEVEVEEECLKILALHQPVAVDLRFIIAVLKINNDLERIGDYAVNIAERARYLSLREKIDNSFEFSGMAEKVKTMLRKSLDALVNMDADLADSVLVADDEVDWMNREMHKKIIEEMRSNSDKMDYYVQLLSVSKYLERIADLATNIAEDVIYLIKGEIVRHQEDDQDIHLT